MQKEAVAQIRARIDYQKSLIAAQHVHDDEDEMYKWLKISLQFAVPVTLTFTALALIFDEHHHRKAEPLPEHMKIRSKEFPWKCSDCDLFDGKCWKACKEGN